MPIVTTLLKSRRNWQKSNTSLKSRKKCFQLMIEYNILKNKWLFLEKKHLNCTINSTKKHKKTNCWKTELNNFKKNNRLSICRKKNKCVQSKLIRWTKPYYSPKSVILKKNSVRKTHKLLNLVANWTVWQINSHSVVNQICEMRGRARWWAADGTSQWNFRLKRVRCMTLKWRTGF